MRRLILFLVVLLVATACGGTGGADTDPAGGDRAEESAGVDASETLDSVEVAEAIAAKLGAEAGFAAVVLALDAGYSLQQIVDAGLEGTLQASGVIEGVSPESPPFGLIEARVENSGALVVTGTGVSGAALAIAGDIADRLAQADEPGISIDDFRERLTVSTESVLEREERLKTPLFFISIVLELAAVGYSIPQIVEAVVSGGSPWPGEAPELFSSAGTPCWALRSSDGTVVKPESEPVGESSGWFQHAPRCNASILGGSVVFHDPAGEHDPGQEAAGAETTTNLQEGAEADDSSTAPPGLYVGTFTDIETLENAFKPGAGPESVTCTHTGNAELTIFPDGRVTAKITYTDGFNFTAQTCTALPEPLVFEPRAWVEGGVVRVGMCDVANPVEVRYDGERLAGSGTCGPTGQPIRYTHEVELDLSLTEPTP